MCGLSTSLPILILWRVVQGMTGGVMQPLSQAIMLEAFPPKDRGKAMAFFGVGVVVAPVLGPVLGGWLTDNWSWRWVFYINLPVGVVAFLMTARQHVRPALHPRGAPGSTTGGSACWPSASPRCRSASTRGSARTGSPRTSSSP